MVQEKVPNLGHFCKALLQFLHPGLFLNLGVILHLPLISALLTKLLVLLLVQQQTLLAALFLGQALLAPAGKENKGYMTNHL